MRLLCGCLLALVLTTSHAGAAALSDGDRQRLVAHLEMTEAWVVSEIGGLSEAQLRFRMKPTTWSIMDVVEHLAVAEGQYWTSLRESMKKPPSGGKAAATDAGILWYGIDRTVRQTTGDARLPTGRWPTVQGSLDEFRTRRAAMRDYARTTQDDLRGHLLIDGDMDVYQWFLMISSHSQRHILQIREVKASAGYPKS